MNVIELLKKELEHEALATRKMLSLVPDDKWDWKPHAKSMNMMQLSTHIAELPGWVDIGLKTDELDFGKEAYQPTTVSTTAELVAIFDKAQAGGVATLANATEEDLEKNWTMRLNEQILSVMTKYEVIRHALAQTLHHRAQLGVFFRLLDIPVPNTLGPTADDQSY
jgi:uncharacterized damage-inducible protein DinB